MDDGVELVEGSCPKCGGEVLRCDCTQIGCDNGFIDMHEYDDPLLFYEGEEEACNECRGRGYLMWCKTCGSDLSWKGSKIMPVLEREEIPMLSDEQIAAWLKQAEYEVEIGSTELLGIHYSGDMEFTTVDLLRELQHLRKVRDAVTDRGRLFFSAFGWWAEETQRRLGYKGSDGEMLLRRLAALEQEKE